MLLRVPLWSWTGSSEARPCQTVLHSSTGLICSVQHWWWRLHWLWVPSYIWECLPNPAVTLFTCHGVVMDVLKYRTKLPVYIHAMSQVLNVLEPPECILSLSCELRPRWYRACPHTGWDSFFELCHCLWQWLQHHGRTISDQLTRAGTLWSCARLQDTAWVAGPARLLSALVG